MLWNTLKFTDVIAISDPHAHLNTTIALLEKIKIEYPNTPVVFIGDLIDKGKRARELVELIKKRDNTFALLGNHDHLMTVENRPSWRRYESLWLINSGAMTHRSYGGKWKIQNRADNKYSFTEHVQWFKSLPIVINFPNIKVNERELVLSHSGLDKAVAGIGSLEKLKELLSRDNSRTLIESHLKDASSIEEQVSLDVLWNHLIEPDNVPDLGIFNAFGHTTHDNVILKEHYACIDTHVYKPNKLSAVHFPSLNIISQETIDDSWGEKK